MTAVLNNSNQSGLDQQTPAPMRYARPESSSEGSQSVINPPGSTNRLDRRSNIGLRCLHRRTNQIALALFPERLA